MAIFATGQPALAAGQQISLNSSTQFPSLPNSNSIPISNQDTGTKDKPDEPKSLPTDLVCASAQGGKYPSYINSIPRITWTEDEVRRMIIIENLQYAVIGKFSYGWPEMDDLRIQIPKQCNVNGGYNDMGQEVGSVE
ncbi:hypothetical protein RDI58_018437 [Solanum bulbocastanum]|uniref:Uncharacterized protein n=1 Tax=Solanum bulbocastanum TaxID=147425 RepID=A0AAN8TGX3_SOLBU